MIRILFSYVVWICFGFGVLANVSFGGRVGSEGVDVVPHLSSTWFALLLVAEKRAVLSSRSYVGGSLPGVLGCAWPKYYVKQFLLYEFSMLQCILTLSILTLRGYIHSLGLCEIALVLALAISSNRNYHT